MPLTHKISGAIAEVKCLRETSAQGICIHETWELFRSGRESGKLVDLVLPHLRNSNNGRADSLCLPLVVWAMSLCLRWCLQWCREVFREKEARLKEFHEGPRSFDQDDDGVHDDEAWRSGLLAMTFLVAFIFIVVFYGGTMFGWYAASACCFCTLVTSLGGFDTLELRWSRFSFGNLAEKHD